MMTNLFDYEMLAQQRSEKVMAEAEQQRLLAQLGRTVQVQRGGLQGLIGLLRARFTGTERPAVVARTA